MQHTLTISENDLRNVLHGLQELHSKLSENLANVQLGLPNTTDLKEYYKEKIEEVKKQIQQYNKILTAQPNEQTA